MKASTQVHLKTIAVVAVLAVFVTICAMHPVILLVLLASAALIFVYGTVYIFLSARTVARRRAAAEAARAAEGAGETKRTTPGSPASSPNEIVTPFRFGVRPPRDRSAIGLVPTQPTTTAADEAPRDEATPRPEGDQPSSDTSPDRERGPQSPTSVFGGK